MPDGQRPAVLDETRDSCALRRRECRSITDDLIPERRHRGGINEFALVIDHRENMQSGPQPRHPVLYRDAVGEAPPVRQQTKSPRARRAVTRAKVKWRVTGSTHRMLNLGTNALRVRGNLVDH